MNFSFFIAKRYLISKKSNNAINIISWISIIAIAITTGALIVILSAMNGLTGAIADLYNSFEPDIKITAAKGKFFKADESFMRSVKEIEGIEAVSRTFSDKALLKNNEKQTLVSVKGVDQNFSKVTKVDSSIIDGVYKISDTTNYIVLGEGVANIVQVNIHELSSELSLLSPSKGKTSSINPEDNFNQVYVMPNGVFALNDEFDYQFVFIGLNTAKKLFGEPEKVSAVEIKCNSNMKEVQEKLIQKLGTDFVIKNRYELNDVLFKTLETEKLATFIILAFILIIATFNIIGALTMLIIEKQKDIKTLFSLGADLSLIRNIFMREGFLITGVGALIGLVLGLLVCLIQIKFHLIEFGDGVIPYWPIDLQLKDFVWIFSLIMLIGFFAALYPVRFFTKNEKLN